LKVAIDFGFGNVKIATSEGKKIKFPTVIKEEMKSVFGEAKPIKYGAKGYYVGDRALKYGKKALPLLNIDQLISFVPLILEYIEKEKGISRENVDGVVSGLPPSYLKDKEKSLKEAIAQGWEISEKKVVILPQGTGILLSVEENISDSAFVLDIGFNTVDWVFAKKEGDTFVVEASGSFPRMGVESIIRELKDELSREIPMIGTLFSVHEFSHVFEEGKIKIAGKEMELEDRIRELVEAYVEDLSRVLEELEEMILQSDALVIGGGGAYVFKSVETERLEKLHGNVIIPNEPEFAQVLGYLKVLK